MPKDDYRAIADALATDIASGALPAGARLLPQREFAYQRGIAASTAGRVYADLRQRGLVTGEVGRGTFVRPPLSRINPALAEPSNAPVDLALNFPILPNQSALLSQSLSSVLRSEMIGLALKPIGAAATPEAREIVAAFFARSGWAPPASNILFTGNGRQAIAASMSALAAPGGRIGVEALTYPVVKSIAARLGITLVPLKLDERGVCPDAVLRAHRQAPLKGLYLQPSLHNPLGVTMDETRRAAIAAVLEKTGIVAIEDTIYSFLSDVPPLAAIAAEHTIVVDSLSKRIAPGTTLGFIAAPARWVDRIVVAVRSGAWSALGLPLALGLRWISDGTVARLTAEKKSDAIVRHDIARDALAGLTVRGDRRAYHLWLELPDGWNGETFASAAAREGIALTPANAFAVETSHVPRAVRLALGAPPLAALSPAIKTLRKLALSDPGDANVE
jgi:DNA-binding transcriptional MocR family regulator